MSPFWVGLIVGFGAALLQAFFKVLPPPAYGVCIACHVRDVVNWVFIRIWPIYGVLEGVPKFVGADVSKVLPVLTPIGILVGAFLSALVHRELRLRSMRFGPQRPLSEFFIGMGVMISALLMGGCPLRTALKSAYLDFTAMIALGMILIGVIVGSEVLKRSA
jgi:hypothetical protein